MSTTKSIYITGDIANDYFLVRGDRFFSDDTDEDKNGTRYESRKGGAYLISELLVEIAKTRTTNQEAEQLQVTFGLDDKVFDKLPQKNHSYVTVFGYDTPASKRKEADSKGEKKNEDKFWRIDEFVGFGERNEKPVDFMDHLIEPAKDTDIFIIDDAGLDLSSSENKSFREGVSKSIQEIQKVDRERFIILKKSGAIDGGILSGLLFDTATSNKMNLLTILSIYDIRKLNVKVSSGLSWEQSAQDIVSELNSNDELAPLKNSKFLVITFQSSGALFVVNNGNKNYEYTLIFDPEKMEGEDQERDKGNVIGRMSVFTAALASRVDLDGKDKHYKITEAIKAALTAVRHFYDTGYIIESKENNFRYPFAEVAAMLDKTKEYIYSHASVPNPVEKRKNDKREWSILIDNYMDKEVRQDAEVLALTALAKNIVIRGTDILKNIPSLRFGDLFTVDRNEIESLRNLKKIMANYIHCSEGKRPLNIGVFGPPGSGKSFAVEEIGRGIMEDEFHLMLFNLSQFNDPEDINGALHQVRDCVIRKTTPVVFWDEFDSHGFRWLQYLLAPMQDGFFQEGQITHPVGKCIFVFAGATSYCMNAFGEFTTDEETNDFMLKKGPDFISRLHGYIDILGINQRKKFNAAHKRGEGKWITDTEDLTYPVRRAIFMAAFTGVNKDDQTPGMDMGLLNALISVKEFKYGSRSLSNLLKDITQNSPRSNFLRSGLPSKSTLELYFDDHEDFLRNLKGQDDFLACAWDIAPVIHSFWNKKIDDPSNQYSVDYNYLPVFIKESNVQAALRIPEVLKAGGFELIRKNIGEILDDEKYSKLINDNNSALLEKMAEKEHELWRKFYEDNGWTYDASRNDYQKKHNCLLPYSELPEGQKEKDREIVSNFSKIVTKAGFGIVKD